MQNKNFTLLGPPSSFALSDGRMFFFGPLIFYLPIPAVLVFGWDALAISYFLMFVQFLGFMVAYLAINKRLGFKTAFFFGFLFSLSPTMVQFSRFLWNPNPMVPICCLLLAAHLVMPVKGKWNSLAILAIGVLWGLGLQAHYAFPDQTTKVARFVGINRGVDFIVYVSIATLFYLVFRIYIMLENLRHEMTEIIRKVALENASKKEKKK